MVAIASSATGETSGASTSGLPTTKVSGDAAGVSPSVRPPLDTTAITYGDGGIAPGEHITNELSSARISSDRPTSGVDTRVEGSIACTATAKASIATDCSTINAGTLGTPVPSALEASALPPAATSAVGGRNDRAVTIFLGASSKGSLVMLALQEAWR